MKKIIYFLFISVLMIGCSVDSLKTIEEQERLGLQMNAKKGNPHDSFGVPEVTPGNSGEQTLQVNIKASTNGATGGLSVRWMTLEDYDPDGDGNGEWNNGMAGHVLLNGNANDAFALNEDDTFPFYLEDYISGEGDSWNRALDCGMSYVFIARAHQDGKMQKSDYSDPVKVSTAACTWCTFDQDKYFKTLENSYVDQKINDNGQIKRFLIQEFFKDEGVPTDGTLDKTNLELLREYNRQIATGNWPLVISAVYTAGEGDCKDSTLLTVEITESDEDTANE